MPIEVNCTSALWEGVDLDAIADRALGAVERRFGGEEWQVDLLACDDAEITRLNGEFRSKPKPTNVLSWPAQDVAPGQTPEADAFGEVALGDLALAHETCRAEAETAGVPLDEYLTHLVVHGLLHLLGYDHIDDREADEMEGLEGEILIGLGLSDPYNRE